MSYFQRFSQPENHATNNTLLVLRYLYEQSPARLQNVLTSLLDEEFAVGLSFEQQVRMGEGIPDALISQKPLRIFIETKTGGHLSHDQIRRHCEGISAGGKHIGDVLIGLTKEAISEHDGNMLSAVVGEHGIRFLATTFSAIADALKRECGEYERELLSLVEDYIAFLADARLLDERNRWMFVNPCKTSYEENIRFSLYYEPSTRRLANQCRYMGIYKDKLVSHVGVIAAIATAATSEDGNQIFTTEAGILTDEYKARISEVIEITDYYNLKDGVCRFYLVDCLEPTQAVKASPGGIRGRTYLDLSKYVPSWDGQKAYTSAELASLLRGACWD